MAVLVDDTDIIESVQKLAAQMPCSGENAIGYAVAIGLRRRRERALFRDVDVEAAKPAGEVGSEAETR